MPIQIETPRLTLRSLTVEDAPLLYDLDSDSAVLRYIGPRRTGTSIDDYRAHIETVYHKYDAAYRSLGFWAVIERSRQEFLGWTCLRPGPDYRFAAEARFRDDDAELGYRLKAAAWGQGYATEAALAVIDQGFREESMARIVASALVENRASTRVMEKCGLARQYEFELAGYSCPAVVYALSRPADEAG